MFGYRETILQLAHEIVSRRFLTSAAVAVECVRDVETVQPVLGFNHRV